MRSFKEMVENARTYGTALAGPKGYAPSPEAQIQAHRLFMRLAEEAEVFVMPRPGPGIIVLPPGQIDDRIDGMDLPFQTCSFESVDGFMKMRMGGFDATGSKVVGLLNPEGEPVVVRIFCVLVTEVALSVPWTKEATDETFEKFCFFVYDGDRVYGISPLATELWGSIVSVTHHWLSTLRSSRVGHEPVKERIKLGRGKEKRVREIRRVIRVGGKKDYLGVPSLYGREIDWSHRWSVMGHWMHYRDEAGALDLTRIGKNREGEYVERGRTWRKDFTKGPEDKPLIKKVRVVPTIHTEEKAV